MARIFIADDDLEILELLKFTFENENHEVLTATDGEEALREIIATKPDVVILDVNMPKLTGFEVCEKLRENSATCLIPIIMLTSLTKMKDKLTGIKLGADEYLAKPFETFEIVARVEGLVRRTKASIAANPLTELPGNLSIESEIKNRLEKNEAFSVLYVDADNFKAFNDKYGFERGDAIIKLLAVILRSSIAEFGSPSDFLGHIGGEDFIVLTLPRLAVKIAENVMYVFDALVPAQYDDEARSRGYIEGINRQHERVEFPLMTVSIGIVTVEPGRYAHYSHVVGDVKEVLRKAKMEAKSSYQGA